MEAAIAQQPVTFVTKKHDWLLTLEPAHNEERDAMNRILRERSAGRHIQFADGEFTTDDPELIEAIRTFWAYNTPDGIWEVGNAPDEPEPKIAAQMSAIARFSVERDADGLRDLIEGEEALHNRTAIVMAGREALAQVADAELQATAENLAAASETEARIAAAEQRAADAEAKLADSNALAGKFPNPTSATDTEPPSEDDGEGQTPEGESTPDTDESGGGSGDPGTSSG